MKASFVGFNDSLMSIAESVHEEQAAKSILPNIQSLCSLYDVLRYQVDGGTLSDLEKTIKSLAKKFHIKIED